MASLTICTLLLFWGYGCPPQTKSLLHNGKKVTRPELQIELDTIVATAEMRMLDLDQQDHVRDIVFKNALLMVEGGTLNPLGILTGMAGMYGLFAGVKNTATAIKKKRES